MKANIGQKNLFVQFHEKYLVFRAKIIGIHTPKKYKDQLVKLYDYLKEKNDLLRFYIACTSSQLLVNRATALLKEDLMRMPYPEEDVQIKLSPAEEIIISDVLNYQLGAEKEKLNQAVSEPQLKSYAKVFEKTLNSVYKTDEKKFQLFKILDAGNYYALHFEYSSKTLSSSVYRNGNLEEYLEALMPSSKKKKDDIHVQRILKFYSKDSVVLSKPKQFRYWLQSVALRDADETFADYLKAGY